MIPLCAPNLRFKRFSREIGDAIRRVFEGGQIILGPEVERFEQSFSAYVGSRHCIGVNSGTDALILSLRALGLQPGDEVITVSMSFSATAMAILHAGGVPRFVDVDPETRCMDLAQLEGLVGPRTVAILPVHLHGRPVDMPRLMTIADRHGLAVVEDCAQAHGARIGERAAGSFGRLAAFSFYPTKNLGCPGDGGAIVTSDPALAARVRALRTYGWSDDRRVSTELGHNSRLDELHAAVLNVLLPHLDEGNRERSDIAAVYRRILEHGPARLPSPHPGAVYHQFAVCVPRRQLLRDVLRKRSGIETGVHYPVPLHRHPLFAAYARAPLPITDELAQSLVSLPIQPEVARDQAQYIAESVMEEMVECAAS